MRWFLYLFAFLIICGSAQANSCTTSGGSGSGNWDTASVWTSCGSTFPGTGDTFVITTGVTVTVENGLTVSWGTSGVTGTVGGTINQGGTLTIASGGIMNGRDTLSLQRGSTFNLSGGGTYNFNCPNGSTCKINLPGTGVGSVNFNVGSSGIFGNLVNVPQSTTGKGSIDFNTNGSDTIINMNGFLISGLGATNILAMDAHLSPSSPHATTFENGLVLNSGDVYLANNNAASNFTISHVDFRGCIDTTASNNGNSCLDELATNASTSGVRTFSYITAYNTVLKNINLYSDGNQCGAAVVAGDGSDIPCFYGYNTAYHVFNTKTFTTRTSFSVADVDVSTSAYMAFIANTGSKIQNNVVLAHNENQHEFGSSSGGASVGANTFSYNVCDGDGFFASDAGDFVNDSGGPSTLSHNININDCGTLITASSSATAFTIDHNTTYQSYAGSVGEGTGAATQVAAFTNNLIVSPSVLNIAAEQGGLWQPAAFVTQTMAANMLDYNAFYGTMNATNLTNASLGGAVSYMGPASVSAWFTSSTYGTTSGYGTHDLNVNPSFADATRTICKWYNSNGGYANCPSTVNRATTSGTNTTTIICTSCNFTTEGIGTNDSVVAYNGSTYMGRSNVTVVNSATSITISPAIASLTSARQFSFVTDTTGIGRSIVTVNGYDYQGNSTTPVSWATAPNALAYIRAGFAPTNVALHNTASDGTDIGAVSFVSNGRCLSCDLSDFTEPHAHATLSNAVIQ